ncbi:hypothetical protein N9772_02225 [Bacteroidia bacterium]|jgi:hypothetical protein|nr:hypothetical protein [Bacteroidia bacterium]
MKLYYIWSSGIEALHHLFQANHKYQDAFEIIDDKIVQLEGESVFKSNVWHNAVLQKTIRDYTALKKNPNKIMVFSDPDICIYDAEKLRAYLENRIAGEDLEFLAMQESHYDVHNGGFLCVRSTKNTLDLYEKSIKVLRYFISARSKPLLKPLLWLKFGIWDLPYLDQTIMNKYLKEGGVNYAYIPGNIGCWGDDVITEDTLFHHAVCTTNQDEKLLLLKNKQIEFNKFHNC